MWHCMDERTLRATAGKEGTNQDFASRSCTHPWRLKHTSCGTACIKEHCVPTAGKDGASQDSASRIVHPPVKVQIRTTTRSLDELQLLESGEAPAAPTLVLRAIRVDVIYSDAHSDVSA